MNSLKYLTYLVQLKLHHDSVYLHYIGQQYAPVSLLHLGHKLISRELASDHQNEVLNDVLRAVHVQQPSNHHG